MGNIALEPNSDDSNYWDNNHNDIGAIGVTGRCDWELNYSMKLAGAQERTRTSTSIQKLAPEASASTSSATWASGAAAGDLGRLCGAVNHRQF